MCRGFTAPLPGAVGSVTCPNNFSFDNCIENHSHMHYDLSDHSIGLGDRFVKIQSVICSGVFAGCHHHASDRAWGVAGSI